MPEQYNPNRPSMVEMAQQFPSTVTFDRVNHIYRVGLQRAKARGLRADDAEDTSQEFGDSWLLDLKADKPWAKRCLESEPYLNSCADKHALTAVVKIQKHHDRERPLLNRTGDEEATALENRSCEQPGPEKQAIRSELRSVLLLAIGQLSPRPQTIYLRRKIKQESVKSIAKDLRCTANAISQSLYASHPQVLMYLESVGYDASEIEEYLYELLGPD